VAANGEPVATYERAADIFESMSLAESYPEFLTLPLYEKLD
jgi:malate synthase